VGSKLLLDKWIWRLESNEGGLWKKVLKSKYGDWKKLKEDKLNKKDFFWCRDLEDGELR